MTNRVKKWYSFLDRMMREKMHVGDKMKYIWKRFQTYPFISIMLVSINCILFLLCQFSDESFYLKGSLGVHSIVSEQEYARFIYAMFLHWNLEHLFNNMILLLFMGSMLEKAVGHIPYVFLYFASGIGGGVLSVMIKAMNNDWAVSAGASGAIFGLDGLLLAVVLLIRYKVQEITPVRVGIMIVLSLYGGFSGSNIDNAAHVGGLIVGFLLGLLICTIIRIRDAKRNSQ